MLGTWPALPVALAPRPSALDLVVVELWARWERQLMEEVDPSVICNHDKLVFIQRAVRHWMGKRRHRPSSSRPTSAWPLDIDSLSKNSIPRATPAVVTGLVTSYTFKQTDRAALPQPAASPRHDEVDTAGFALGGVAASHLLLCS